MREFIHRAVFAAILLSTMVVGGKVELIEPADAIRLIGDDGVLFISGEGNETYSKGHIIGSISAPTKDIYLVSQENDTECSSIYSCPKEAQIYLQNKGVKNDHLIIVYDKLQAPNAASLYSFFERVGHKNLRFLNGGIDAIMALDPNQLVFDKLKLELDSIKVQLQDAKESNSSDLEEDLSAKIEDVVAKMDFIKSKLLTVEGDPREHAKSNYLLKVERLNRGYIASQSELDRIDDEIFGDANGSGSVIIELMPAEIVVALDENDSNQTDMNKTKELKYLEWRGVVDFENKKSYKSLEEIEKIFNDRNITKDKMVYIYSKDGIDEGMHIGFALRLLGYDDVKVFTDNQESNSSQDKEQTQK